MTVTCSYHCSTPWILSDVPDCRRPLDTPTGDRLIDTHSINFASKALWLTIAVFKQYGTFRSPS